MPSCTGSRHFTRNLYDRSRPPQCRHLPNRLVIETRKGGGAAPAPLLAARRVIKGREGAARGEQNPLMRRLCQVAARMRGSARDFGPDPSQPILAHFAALVTARQSESPVLGYDVMADIHRWAAAVKQG